MVWNCWSGCRRNILRSLRSLSAVMMILIRWRGYLFPVDWTIFWNRWEKKRWSRFLPKPWIFWKRGKILKSRMKPAGSVNINFHLFWKTANIQHCFPENYMDRLMHRLMYPVLILSLKLPRWWWNFIILLKLQRSLNMTICRCPGVLNPGWESWLVWKKMWLFLTTAIRWVSFSW